MPTNVFSIEPLKVKLLEGEQEATEMCPALFLALILWVRPCLVAGREWSVLALPRVGGHAHWTRGHAREHDIYLVG